MIKACQDFILKSDGGAKEAPIGTHATCDLKSKHGHVDTAGKAVCLWQYARVYSSFCKIRVYPYKHMSIVLAE